MLPVRTSFNYQINPNAMSRRKSHFSNNTLVFYKNNSTSSNKSGTVVNSRAVARRT